MKQLRALILASVLVPSIALAAEVTDVDITNGVPTGGTGTVPTLSKTNTKLDTIITNTSSATPAGTNATGRVWGNYTSAQLSSAPLSFNSSGNNTIVTRTVATIKVYGLILSCASAVTTLTPQNGTSTSLGALSNVSSVFLPISTEPYYTTSGSNNFVINLSSSIQCGGTVYYLEN